MRVLFFISILSIVVASCGLQGVTGNKFTRCVSSILMNPTKADSICKSNNIRLVLYDSLSEKEIKILEEISKSQGRANWSYISNSDDKRYGVIISSKDYQYCADFDFKFENNEWILYMIRPGDENDKGIFE